ncbi:hypothetical protein [Borreliella burgdorferi]|uniref:Outer membrane protein n=1 Tax=Borreliella burgdorferi 118a TaxID=476210 RepID=A0A7U3YBK7_BORBG|nr:hypothetical protein [Borreliella burgdorferi]EEG99417.1 outer membrane protein [Borreliella burgdorferi 94a]ACN93051.1 outer membrane protein [Borreliella burgdorferi 118a]AXK69929.1 outer membrane protein [Borreliella burgdorferi]MCD2374849.1 hypothetical protein [Borreliella burgdorferi]MCD2387426.1 hypothetical protein [Borreliella burgdorferi]
MSFFNLGPEKSKELINLFRKIKVKLGNNNDIIIKIIVNTACGKVLASSNKI